MQIRNLSKSTLKEIIDCLLISFKDYFVKMPEDLDSWKNRFHAARVDYSLSFGCFENEKLVAFIINGVDTVNSKKTAFNTGTGVLPDFRGKKLVDQMYEFAIPILKANGVKICSLEVIQQNDRAIRVYERIGFKINRKVQCFNAELNFDNFDGSLKKIPFTELRKNDFQQRLHYSWDNSDQAIKKGDKMYSTYQVFNSENNSIGFFVLNEKNGYLPQFQINEEGKTEDWSYLFSAIASKSKKVKTNNLDEQREMLSQQLFIAGFKNPINQYEMELSLKD